MFDALGLGPEAREYRESVMTRFRNPFLDHYLADIYRNHAAKKQRRFGGLIALGRQCGLDLAQPRLQPAWRRRTGRAETCVAAGLPAAKYGQCPARFTLPLSLEPLIVISSRFLPAVVRFAAAFALVFGSRFAAPPWPGPPKPERTVDMATVLQPGPLPELSWAIPRACRSSNTAR